MTDLPLDKAQMRRRYRAQRVRLAAADPDAARALVRAAADLIAVVRDRQAAELVRRRLSGL